MIGFLHDNLYMTPLLFLVGFYVLSSSIRETASMHRFAVFMTFVLAFFYLRWRIGNTLNAPHLGIIDHIFIYSFFFVELLNISNQVLSSIVIMRTSDRTPLADLGERMLSLLKTDQYPSVDVFITTLDEPIDVLRRTILCAKEIDWPKERLHVWVLDDGRREWLRDFCAEHGVGYITRPDNRHAKAGNINHALGLTSAPFILILDADFIPTRRILKRTIGLFADPKVGIVQTPHRFFNPDPISHNLYISKIIPSDQEFFFSIIQPARDGWDAAFCCGSNGIIRRSALKEIGGLLPTESVTEDLLLTMKLLRKGYVTRYLNEPLAWGLAPENLRGFVVQRRRWCRGAIQILFLKDGPLGRGLRPIHHLLFLLNPLYWISVSMVHSASIFTPIIFMLTGYVPIANVSWEDVLFFQMPVMFYFMTFGSLFSKGKNHPLVVNVFNTFLAVILLPVVLSTLIRPFGHAFQVTPKGTKARAIVQERKIKQFSIFMIALTVLGFVLNAFPGTRIVGIQSLLPVTIGWASWNIIVLALVHGISEGMPVRRKTDRFNLKGKQASILWKDQRIQAAIVDMSEGGALISISDSDIEIPKDDTIVIETEGFPVLTGKTLIQRNRKIPCQFMNMDEHTTNALLIELHSGKYTPVLPDTTRGGVSLRLLSRMIRAREDA